MKTNEEGVLQVDGEEWCVFRLGHIGTITEVRTYEFIDSFTQRDFILPSFNAALILYLALFTSRIIMCFSTLALHSYFATLPTAWKYRVY